MSLVGSNAPYGQILKCALQPRIHRTNFLRSLKTTSRNGLAYADLPDFTSSTLPPPNPHAREIAILGGGLTGLSTAFHLTRQLPNAKITLFEKSNRLGGWMDSEVVKVDDEEVLFEWGPRTIRSGLTHSPKAMLELIGELDLEKDLVATLKTSPAARNRYIYYPDHIVKLPATHKGSSISDWIQSAWALCTEPVFDGIWQVIQELNVPLRNEAVKDESVGDFISRRFGTKIADNLVSAVYHGIYAGDIYKLSARTLMSRLWHLETRDRGILVEILSDMLNRHIMIPAGDARYSQRWRLSDYSPDTQSELYPNPDVFLDVSVYTFRRGIGQLSTALEKKLRSNANVSFKKSTAVDSVIFNKEKNKMSISSKGAQTSTPAMFDYAVSTLEPESIKRFFKSDKTTNPTDGMDAKVIAACDHANVSVNVMVINLYYSNPNLLPDSVQGFGYLIPRSVPVEQNPERALGVIFSSETSGATGLSHPQSGAPFFLRLGSEDVDDSAPLNHDVNAEIISQDTAPGTKLTVMMGGHWWSDWAPDDIPSEEQAIEMAQSVLARHLDIHERPAVAKARLARNCIPQYPVGYSQDMATVHDALMSTYQGRLKVAGPWWQGAPGLNDSVRSACETAWAIRDQKDEYTGLQNYMKEQWIVHHEPTHQSVIQQTK